VVLLVAKKAQPHWLATRFQSDIHVAVSRLDEICHEEMDESLPLADDTIS
jgi:hypothetical protein